LILGGLVMDFNSGIMIGKSAIELGQGIAKLIKKAKDGSDVTKRVPIYLDVVKTSVGALGMERQQILTDVRKCDLNNEEQVNALWNRFNRYLFEDNIRPKLVSAIEGLTACKSEIEKKSKAWWWRAKNKEEAVKSFMHLLDELELLIAHLTSDFFPGGSGMGINTLIPVYNAIDEIRKKNKSQKPDALEIENYQEQIYQFLRDAIRDSSHEEWFRVNGKVEALTTELQLAFSIKVLAKTTRDSE
jgi:hypothetical protein